MSVSAAKSRVMQAKMQIEGSRFSDAESSVAAGLKFLDGLPEAETAAVRAELLQLQATIANQPKEEDVRSVAAAMGKLRQARSQIADKQTSGTADVLRTAEGYLAAVPDAMKATLIGEIAALRATLLAPKAEPVRAPVVASQPASGAAAAPAPVVAAAPPRSSVPAAPAPSTVPAAPARPIAAAPAPAAAPAALSDDDHANLSRARGRVSQAKSLLETGRTENIPLILDQAAGFLALLPASAGAALTAEVASLRQQLSGANAAEDTRRISEELNRHLETAEQNVRLNFFRQTRDALDHVESRVKDEDVRRILTADALAAAIGRAAGLRTALAAAIKADGLARALPILGELEARVATDPFDGRSQRETYEATSAMESFKHRIRAALRPVPEGDADVAAIESRILAVDKKVDEASVAWGKARLDESVVNSWSVVEAAIAGWDEETDTDDRALVSPELPKTRMAIQRIKYLLADPETKKIRDENKGDPKIESTYSRAEQIFEAAAAKLNAAFNASIESGEKLETPLNRFVLDRPGHLAYDVEQALAGTPHAAATAARARTLDDRWKAEVAAIMKARQELCDKLTVEADAAWPAIDAGLNAAAFDPERAKPGAVVRLAGVYNRCGWDYSGRQYDFAVCLDETVIAGAFEPHIVKAIEHACYELKIEVSDRMTWDVIGVVVGPGKIGERTEVVLRDKFTNFEIGKLEEWPLIDCVKIRITALHAGPVAVGP